MEIFNKCFENLVFTRVDEKEGYVIYGAGISSGLGGGYSRYVLLFVPSNKALKKQARIHELEWQNLQTRNLTYSYRLKGQSWIIPLDFPKILLEIQQRTKSHSSYKAVDGGFPFEILLLHDPKKKTVYQYNNKIMLEAAISTFNAVINYVEEQPGFSSPPKIVKPLVHTSLHSGSAVEQQGPSIKNWFQAGGDSNYISNVNNSHDSDDSFELV